ncbi:MAG: metallophosphoesterase [Pirellulales bacterium]
MHRRCFLHGGVLTLSALPWLTSNSCLASLAETQGIASTKLGLVTDLHFADKAEAGTRYYRETLSKIDEASEKFRASQIDALVELGDLIDAAKSPEEELKYLETIQQRLTRISDQRHYVLGNHCVSTLTKEAFLKGIGRTESYYSFDLGSHHFIVLDACFRSDGVAYGQNNFQWTDTSIPKMEVDWLRKDLAATEKPTIVFAHQRLDVSNDHGVKNGGEIRSVLEGSTKVSTVFQGHSHKNDLRRINGIDYVTLVAMVEGSGPENNGYSVLEIFDDGSIRLEGFRQQKAFSSP